MEVKRTMLRSSVYLIQSVRPSTERNTTKHKKARERARILHGAICWFLKYHNDLEWMSNQRREKIQKLSYHVNRTKFGSNASTALQ